MATTRLMKLHTGSGKTIAQSMKDSYDYGKNPDKTRGGKLIASYMCDYETADAEFLLSKAKYKAVTGKEQKKDDDVLSYQIRQAFLPGETDYETALKIGYDLAMRWTKGKHAFFVVSHTDRPHAHVQIYYNSTSLDCTKKFRDFYGSAWALRRLSDRICLENNLSVIHNPKLKSKGKFKHYGEWLGSNKPPTFQDRLKQQIDICLSNNPGSLDEFIQAMEAAGFAHKWGRGGVLSFRVEGQERFTRLRSSTLGKGYGQDDILAIIEGRGVQSGGRIIPPRRVNLLVDIQAKLKAGKGPAYEQWAKVYNLKMMAAALQYLQENGLTDYDELKKKTAEVTGRFHTLSDKIKTIEGKQKTNAELRAASVDYAKTRPVFDEYKRQKYSNKYLSEHEDDIKVYREAQATFRRLLDGAKLPKMDELRAEAGRLASDKKEVYREYREVRKDMQDIVTAKSNIDHLLGLTDGKKNREKER